MLVIAVHGHRPKGQVFAVEHLRAPRPASVRRLEPLRRMEVSLDEGALTPVKYWTERDGAREPSDPRDFVAHLRAARHVLLEDGSLRPLLERYQVKGEVVPFCRLCFQSGRVTVTNDQDIRWGQGRLCIECAEQELKREFASWFGRIVESDLKPVLRKKRDLDEAMRLFDPRVDPLETPSKTLHSLVEAAPDASARRPVGSLGLPQRLAARLREDGVEELTPVQELAVQAGLLEGRDLLVVSSTASGKTLVGELAGVPRALSGRRFLFLVPLVALANQKYHQFTERYSPLGLRAALRVGFSRLESVEGVNTDPSSDIVVGTYEGLDHMMRCGTRPSDVGCVAIDEVHMLGDEERGPRLDGLVARLRSFAPQAQLVGLSASVGNPRRLAESLGMELVEHRGRPVALERHLAFAKDVPEKERLLERYCAREWGSAVAGGARGQSLVFTNARRRAEELAKRLERSGVPARPYHSGLAYSARKAVEREFLSRSLGAVVSTSALGAGVDFPASQVVFESLAMGVEWLTVQEFEQMAGRAGRPSYHDRGTVVVLAEVGRSLHPAVRGTEDDVAFGLLEGAVEPVEVGYSDDDDDEQVLASLVCGVAPGEVEGVLARSVGFDAEVGAVLVGLRRAELVEGERPTPLGAMASRHFLTADEARLVDTTLDKGPEAFLGLACPFDRAYLGVGLQRTIEGVLGIRAPVRFFDGRFLDVYEQNRERLEARMGRYVRSVTRAFFSCHCRGRPFCGCPERAFTAYVLSLRRAGLDPRSISKRALKDWWLSVYSGDVVRWLDDAIRWLEAREEVARIRGAADAARSTRELRARLSGRSQPSWSNDG